MENGSCISFCVAMFFLAKLVLENKTYQVLNQKCWLGVVGFFVFFITCMWELKNVADRSTQDAFLKLYLKV